MLNAVPRLIHRLWRSPFPKGEGLGVPHYVIQALSTIGVEESTTWDDEPPQDKICNLSGFLDSLRSLGMTCRGVVPVNRPGCIRNVAGGYYVKRNMGNT